MTLAEKMYESDFVRKINQMVARRTGRVNLDIYYSPYRYSSSSWRGLWKPKIAPKGTEFLMRLTGLSEREDSSIFGMVEEYQGAVYVLRMQLLNIYRIIVESGEKKADNIITISSSQTRIL